MTGFIKLHRQITNWEWYSDINVCRVFLHCLLQANHTEKKWQGIKIQRASFTTSYEKLAIGTNLTIQQVRTALKKLISTHEITYKSHSQYSIITINNYDKYQDDNKQNNKQITNNQQTNNKQITTTNNVKNVKNEKNNNKKIFMQTNFKNSDEFESSVTKFYPPSVDEVREYCIERGNAVSPERFVDYYSSKGWIVGKTKMKDWKAAVRTWETNMKSEVKEVWKL